MSKIIADIDKINTLRMTDSIDIYGFKDPQIVMQEGRNFIIVKEGRKIKTFNDFKKLKDRKEKYENKDIGIVFTGNDEKKIDFHENITDKLYNKSYFGGSNNYYEKYIKYKTKYIELKRSLTY